MLTQEQKLKLIKEVQAHDTDTGSPEVQISLLTEEINRLVSHLKKNPKDFTSKRGLLKMVTKRRSLLKYLKEQDEKRYNKALKGLKLKK
jgi:small subunit ribosomal protein S15